MKEKTKDLLMQAWQYCDDEDKSTEFMLQYMADISGMSYDAVVDYLASDKSDIDRTKWHQKQTGK